MNEQHAHTGLPAGYRNDQDALIHLAQRDPNAFGALYDRFIQPVYRYLASRLGDPHAAQVVTARTFLSMRAELGTYQRQGSFAAWLFSIARSQLSGYSGSAGQAAGPRRDGLSEGQSRRLENLRGLIRGLGEGEQELLRLRYTAELGLADTASLLGRSPEAVNRSLMRLLDRLQNRLEAGQNRATTPPRRFELEVRAAERIEDADPGFTAGLRRRLLADRSPAAVSRWLAAAQRSAAAGGGPAAARLASQAGFSGLTWVLLFIALALFLALSAALVIGPQRVWEELLALARSAPQAAVVEPVSGQRAVALPAWQEREGIRVTIEQGLADDQQVAIIYRVEGIQADQRPGSDADDGCRQAPTLSLPDGSLLSQTGGEGSKGPTGYRSRAIFPPVPVNVNEISLVLACLDDTRLGAAPENWVMPLQLGPAPTGSQKFPWIDPLNPQPSPTAAGQIVPRPSGQAETAAQANGDPAGVRFTVEQTVEMEGGYLFQGSLYWQGTPFNSIGFDPYQLELRDAEGNAIPLEPAEPDTSGYDPAEKRLPWAARTAERGYPAPLTLALPSLEGFQQIEGSSFELDLGAAPEPGKAWTIDRVVEAAGQPVHVISAELSLAEDNEYWLYFKIQVDPERVTGLTLHDPDNHSAQIGGQGGSDGQGLHTQGFSYDYLPEGARRIEISGLSLLISGGWAVPLTLPAGEGASSPPTASPAACLSAANWSALAAVPTGGLPAGLGGRVLVEGSNRPGENFPTLLAANLDSSRRLEIGPGSWGALAPDGTRAAYIASDGLHLYDLATLQDRRLEWAGLGSYHPLFSPDGEWLAFNVSGKGISTSRLDGRGLSQVSGTDGSTFLAGWLPDGQGLVIVRLGMEGSQVQTVDLASGAVSERFVIDNRQGGYTLPAPDGQRIAFSESVFGQPAYGVYMANLDGSDKRLLASAGTVGLTAAAWSSDGTWLLVTAQNTALAGGETLHFLIQPDTCQVARLADPGGIISDWKAGAP